MEGGSLEPVTPDSIAGGLLRPDGRAVAVRWHSGEWVYPLGAGSPRIVPGLDSALVVRWSPDGSALWVRALTGAKFGIDRVDVATGRRTFLVAIETPADLPIFSVGRIVMADDPQVYAYFASSYLSLLYTVRGIR